MPRSAARALDDGSRVPGWRRPVRIAARSAVSRLALTLVPSRSRCRSTPPLAHVSGIEMDLTLGRLRPYRRKYDDHSSNSTDTGPPRLRQLRAGLLPRDVTPGPGRDQGTRPGRDRPPAPRADPDPRLAAQRLRLLHRHAHQGRARDRRDRAAHLRTG